jgi:hypothetical protein
VRDDRGASVRCGFIADDETPWWSGTWRSPDALALDTAWIELAGTRIELDDHPRDVSVRTEELVAEAAAWRHLDR